MLNENYSNNCAATSRAHENVVFWCSGYRVTSDAAPLGKDLECLSDLRSWLACFQVDDKSHPDAGGHRDIRFNARVPHKRK